jgi:hypothetical protein
LPKSLVAWFGVLSGALSIVILLKNALDVGVGPTLTVLIEYYDKLLRVVLGWAEPFLEQLFNGFLSLLGVAAIEIDDVWKHVTVLIGLYFLRNVTRLYESGKAPAATYQLGFAIIFMFLFGGAAGVSRAMLPGFWSHFGVVMWPILGTFAMNVVQGFWFATYPADRAYRTWPDFGGSWSHFVGMQAKWAAYLALSGLALAVVFMSLPVVAASDDPAVLALCMLVVAFSGYWFFIGDLSVRKRGVSDQPYIVALLESPGGKVGLAMGWTIVAVVAFLVANAGLSIVGL